MDAGTESIAIEQHRVREVSRNSTIEAVIVAGSLALLAFLARPLLTGRVFTMADLASFHLPMRAIYQEGLRSGYVPIWTPSLYAGFYAHGEGQTGMLHPLHLLLYGALPLQVAFNLELLANYVAAFFGMFWLLCRLHLGRAGALFGALLFAFSGFHLFHFLHLNLVAGSVHIPWLLASLDVVIMEDAPSRRAFGIVAIACVLASEILVGFPQAVWWNLLVGAAFASLRAFESGRGRRLISCVFAVVCGVLLGAIQILPTVDLLPHTNRAGVWRAFALDYSLAPLNFLQFWSPYVFEGRTYSPPTPYDPWTHEYAVYSGAILLVALPWLWIRRTALAPRRRLIVACAAFAVVAFVLALGRYGYLDVALTYLPVVGSFRAPCRYVLLTQLALAVLAAIVFDDLASLHSNLGLRPRDLTLLCVPLALSVLTAALLSTHLVALDGVRFARPIVALGGTAIVAAITAAVILSAAGRRWGLMLLAALTAADLAISGLSYVFATRPQTIDSLLAGLRSAPGPGWRVATPSGWNDLALLKGYRIAGGYSGLFQATTLPYTGEQFQRLAGVRGRFGDDFVFSPLADPIARARLLVDVRTSSNPGAEIDRIDIHRTALVAGTVPALSGLPGSATVAVDRPGRIVVNTVAPGRQLLTVSERFDEGWRATQDGRAIPVLRINGDFLGCVIDAGAHEVELRFQPRSFSTGAFVSALGLVMLAVAAVVTARRKPRP
jgi:Bacterial membrane protein YfhO